MKNFRKILALVLAVVMTVSTFTVAFAAETTKTDGQKLKELGLIVGNAAGDLMENSTITRAETAQIVVRVMNWPQAPVSAYTFVDATWAKAQAATLVREGITAGVGNNKFGGTVVMDQLQVYAWIYSAVTGDKTSAWANPSLLAAILTPAQVAAVSAAKGTPAKRSEIFAGMITVLTTEIDGVTQLDKLIEAGVVTEAAAIAAGIIKAPITDNVITSVELLNYKEAKVTFSVAASDSKAAYKFGGDAVTNVTISADKKVATVVMANALVAQKAVTFNYAKDGYTFEKKDLSIIDATLPTVVDVKTTDKGMLTITFSEAINPATSTISVKVDNGMLYASVSAISADGKSVVATVSSATDGKEYKIEISGAKDYAGYAMAPKTIESYKYESVKAPITVAVKEANSKKVVLSLSAATVKTVDKANFTYILNQTPFSATLAGDNKEVVLDLSGYNAPEGTWTLTIKKADEMFVDSWGNKSAADLTLSFTVVIDKTAPTVAIKEVKQSDGKLVVVYNEAVDSAASNYANYEIQGADGKVITDAFVTTTLITNTDSKEFTLALKKEAFVSENCTLVVKKDVIADASGNKVAETKITFATKYMKLLTASITAVKASDATKTSKLYVTYTNNMVASTTDTAKWAVSAGEIKSISFDEGSTKVVVITLKADTTIAGLVVTTTAINDVDGNTLNNQKLSVSFAALSVANVIASTTTMTAAALDAQTVEIVIVGKVTEGVSTGAFLVDYVGSTATKTTTVAAVSNVTVKDIDGKVCTVITVSLPELYKVGATALNAGKEVRVTASGLVLNSGVKLEATEMTVSDKIAPTAGDLTVSVASKTATIALSEAVVANATLLATELVVKYDGKVLVAGNDYTLTAGANIVITLTIDKVEKDKEVVVTLVKSSNYAKDAKGNALAAFEKTDKAE